MDLRRSSVAATGMTTPDSKGGEVSEDTRLSPLHERLAYFTCPSACEEAAMRVNPSVPTLGAPGAVARGRRSRRCRVGHPCGPTGGPNCTCRTRQRRQPRIDVPDAALGDSSADHAAAAQSDLPAARIGADLGATAPDRFRHARRAYAESDGCAIQSFGRACSSGSRHALSLACEHACRGSCARAGWDVSARRDREWVCGWRRERAR